MVTKRVVFFVHVWIYFLIVSYQLLQEDEHRNASYRRPEELFCGGEKIESTMRVWLLRLRCWRGRRLKVGFLIRALSGLSSYDGWRRNICLKKNPIFAVTADERHQCTKYIQNQLTGAADTMITDHDSRVGRIICKLNEPA